VAKLLLLIVAGFVIYWLLKGYRRSVERSEEPRPRTPEDMVRCAQCGVHLPRSESIMSGGKHYCTDEHRRLHQG
jgi:uncharacterized protein